MPPTALGKDEIEEIHKKLDFVMRTLTDLMEIQAISATNQQVLGECLNTVLVALRTLFTLTSHIDQALQRQ